MTPDLARAKAHERPEPDVEAGAVVPSLPWTGERFIPTEGGPEIYYEHAHRYTAARSVLAGRTVVDLASGEGYGAAWIAQIAAAVVGVDIDEPSVRHASVRYRSQQNLSFARGDIEHLPLADSCADAVTCFEAIEHVPNPRRVVEETARILKPGGLFFVSTPNKALYTDARDYTNEFHVHEFYLPEFERLLDEFFPDHMLLGQRVIAGSLTWPLAAVAGEVLPGHSPLEVLLAPGFGRAAVGAAADHGPPSMIEPLYVIAACRLAGAAADPVPLPLASVLVDPEEILLDVFRRNSDPADVTRALERYEQELQSVQAREREKDDLARFQLDNYEQEIRLLQSQVREKDAQLAHSRSETRRLRGSFTDLESMVTLRHQQGLATVLREDLQAATELNARLLAEVQAGQDAIVRSQLSEAARDQPTTRGPADPGQAAAPTSASLLSRARLLLARARRNVRPS